MTPADGTTHYADDATLARMAELEREIERLRNGYAEAIEDIAEWSAYASDYFREKHDLAGTLERHRAALAPHEEKDHKCQICGGDLTITATLIECQKCRTLWGRVNGRWVEVPPDPPAVAHDCVVCAVTREAQEGAK